MERNVRLLLAYDGTDFHGWQKQPGQRTVQDLVEQALRRVVRHQINLVGASRTDAGVHARGQVAGFRTSTDIPCHNLKRAIGGRLPKDIALVHVRDVPLSFRASRDPISKLYRYTVHNDADRPVEELRQRYVYHFWNPLDVDFMRAASRHLVGEHDFAAFATTGHQRLSTVRTILRAEVHRRFREIRIDFEGTGFLYNQVRNMVGTLLEIGRGHWPVERMPEILASRDRRQAGPTAPARGLRLEWIKYDLTRLSADTVEGDVLPDEQPAETDDPSAESETPESNPEPAS
ncbi:MAG TPA: tRNA pseudouridine(38-40) synthase TruA [Phycisphaerae bacterium]|nr:tRNA pseudouridine(38-40) synthase TruA [Phycisphaerae bacterium]